MNIFKIVVGIASLGAEAGVSTLIGNIAGTIGTKGKNKIIDKLCFTLGTAVISGMVCEATGNYIERKAEEIKDAVTPGYMKELETDDSKEDKGEEEVDANE